MKTSKNKKTDNKFDLAKMKVAKLKNMHIINGGYAGGVNTGTGTYKPNPE
jgi:ribosome-interacting GTPase 1